ncbi:hypothetical protein ABES02_23485 [Neobacillus pocheonensis]|uniref:hypothetical protein n=1 Tax=Neobacillus pocheonensis TaxID=363869 RepID=UPI003D274D85
MIGNGNHIGIVGFDSSAFVRAPLTNSANLYTVTYKAYDQAGNSVIKSQEIIVPHDNSNK